MYTHLHILTVCHQSTILMKETVVGYATSFWRHFHVVFDVRVLDLNLSRNIVKLLLISDRDQKRFHIIDKE
jgi:uncharacterized protein (DUF983 family)